MNKGGSPIPRCDVSGPTQLIKHFLETVETCFREKINNSVVSRRYTINT